MLLNNLNKVCLCSISLLKVSPEIWQPMPSIAKRARLVFYRLVATVRMTC